MTVLHIEEEPKGFAFENTPKDGRAWVIFQSPIEITLKAGPVTDTTIGIRNTGEYPAILKRSSLGMLFLANELGIHDFVKRLDDAPSEDISPPPLNSGQYGGINAIVHETITDDMVTSINNKEKQLIVLGKLWYTDKAGTKGESWFCGRYDPSTHRVEPLHECNGMK